MTPKEIEAMRENLFAYELDLGDWAHTLWQATTERGTRGMQEWHLIRDAHDAVLVACDRLETWAISFREETT